MNEIVKELTENDKDITLSWCCEIEFRLAECIRRKFGYTVTDDFDTYWYLDSNKYTMEVTPFSEIKDNEQKRNEFYEFCDEFFGVGESNVDRDKGNNSTEYMIYHEPSIISFLKNLEE